MYNKALAFVSGSRSDDKVITTAKELAEKGIINEINILFVTPKAHIAHPDGLNEPVPDDEVGQFTLAQITLDKAYRNIGNDIKVIRYLQSGLSADTILRMAEELQVDIIIISRYGSNKENESLTDSVSVQVSQKASCSILIVK